MVANNTHDSGPYIDSDEQGALEYGDSKTGITGDTGNLDISISRATVAGLGPCTSEASGRSGETMEEISSSVLCSLCARTEWEKLGPHVRKPTSPKDSLRRFDRSEGSCILCHMLELTRNQQRTHTINAHVATTYFYREEFAETSKQATKGHSPSDFATVLIPDTVSATSSVLLGIRRSTMPEQKFAPRLINPSSVDYSLLQDWLATCSGHSSSECSTNKSTNVWGFRLILCQARQVVQAPRGSPYVALSYVWGDQPGSLSLDEPNDFPRTVSDGMAVALDLGFEYLCEWPS